MFKMFNRRVHLLTYSVLTELLGAKFRKRFLLVCCFFFLVNHRRKCNTENVSRTLFCSSYSRLAVDICVLGPSLFPKSYHP